MVGNVSEWCCDAVFVNVGSSKGKWTEIRRPLLGENYRSDSRNDKTHEYNKHSCSGFRLARNVKK